MSFRSYIAGLGIPTFTEIQTMNGVAVVALGFSFYLSWPGSEFKAKVEREAGKPVKMEPGLTRRAMAVTGVHALGLFVPALTFLVALPVNQFVMPKWLARADLPWTPSPNVYYAVRAAGCVGAISLGALMVSVFNTLGSQWNFLGVRERPKLVNSGVYSLVRHPMYSLAMGEEVFMAMMFWNWMPLVALAGVLIPAFAIKMPMEEQAMLDNKEMGDAYKAYKKQVPWRVFPYIW
ncbi:isoprenylcysteine carboxyl methyltransferase [Ceratobasidium sp. AG-Ba]|nr:isoprenylcysteine carboxyl methyltransferase [Ceratobasidium sp. AG-Ba]